LIRKSVLEDSARVAVDHAVLTSFLIRAISPARSVVFGALA
jgi:hypothetical protein